MVTLTLSCCMFLLMSPLFAAAVTRQSTVIRETEAERLARREIEADKFLARVNRPYVKSFTSAYGGDIVDCVRIKDQLTLDDTLMKNHTIRMRPRWKPEDKPRKVFLMPGEPTILHHHNDDDEEEVCPEGTIPLTRIRKENVLKFDPIESYGQKKIVDAADNGKHEHALAIARGDDDIYRGTYVGARAQFNTWQPYVEHPTEFSSAQLCIVSREGPYMNSIEAGWQVYQKLYGDSAPRFFIYYTNNNYETGCYNNKCKGFVQTDYSIRLGEPLRNVSSYKGEQHSIKIEIYQDPYTQNWWLEVNGVMLGYFPNSVVPELSDGASEIHWGGEVVRINNGRHTAGSGHFPEEVFGKASYVTDMEVLRYNKRYWKPPTDVEIRVTNPNCYRIKMHTSRDHLYFFYGGNGRSNNSCK